MKKKILFINHSTAVGGAPLSLLYLIQKLDKNIYEPIVLFFAESKITELYRANNIAVIIMNKKITLFIHCEPIWYRWYQPHKFFKGIISYFKVVFIYSRQIYKQIRPDLIHINSTFLTEWSWAAKSLKIPVITHIREPLTKGYFGLRQRIIRNILKNNTVKIIAISNDNAKRIKLPEKTVVIYNSVDFQKFNKNITSLYNNNSIYVLYMGGHIKYKGFNVMVEALKYLKPNIIVLFVGYYSKGISSFITSDFSRAKNLETMRNSKNAIEIGILTDIVSLIASSTVVVFPAINPHFGRPIIEAGAMGKAVVASNIKGMDEIVINGYNGYLFENKNALDLAEKLNKICSDKVLSKNLGENGYKIAKERYNSDINIKQVINIYDDIIN